jgi:type IV secretory pathway TrbF-like protein
MKTKHVNERIPELKPSDNPYLDNQQGYMDRLDAERANTATWKHIAWFSIFITFVAVCGSIYLGSLPDIVPFIFKQDGSGGITALGIANQPMKVNNAMVAGEVRKFVIALNQVPKSTELRAEQVNTVSNMATEASFSQTFAPMLKQKYKDVGTREVLVQITNILPIQKNSWTVDWIETLDGQANGTFRGNISLEKLPDDYKQTTDQMIYNPLRLVVTDFTFNKNVGAQE